VSLRTRLLIAIGIIAVVALAVVDVVTYSQLESFLYQRVDQQLVGARGLYEHAIEQGRPVSCAGPGGPFGGGAGAPGGGDADGNGPSNAVQSLAVQVRTASGKAAGLDCPVYIDNVAYTPSLPSTLPPFQTADDGSQVTTFDAPSTQSGGPDFRVQASTLSNGDVLVIAQPLGDTESTLHHLLLVELIVTGAAVVVALLGGFWLVRLGLRPLRDMETAAESIAEGNLTERVPGENGTTEVGRLARTLNVMLSRIESAFRARVATEERLRESDARLRRFVGDASHELRTPIAAISAYAQLFGRGASEQKEDLERLMGGILTETGRMEHLVADLLLLARLDEGRPMEPHPVDLVALCAEAVQTSQTVGPAWPVTFRAPHPIEVSGDARSLRQVIDNLLANIRSHTPEGTTTRVSVEPDGAGAVIVVADDGPGMSPEQVAHVFERFYRSDPSRSRLHGGAGLGLSIVSAIVAAHGGTVSASSAPGQGTTFTVRLPARPPEVPAAELPPAPGLAGTGVLAPTGPAPLGPAAPASAPDPAATRETSTSP
jgi:two-component system OmpR family sensor kinase